MLHFINNRRKVQKKITSFAGGVQNRRVQTPPSPSSFVSRGDIVDINDNNDSPTDLAPPAHSFNPDRSSSPRVQLDLNYRTSTISDWFPSDLLRNDGPVPELPARNVSLPKNDNGDVVASGNANGSGSGSGDVSVNGAVVAGASAGNGYDYDAFNDVIVIEPERHEPTPEISESMPDSSEGEYDEPTGENPDYYMKALPRKPTPTPIKIPNNPTGSKIKIQRSASAGTSAGPHSYLPLPPGSNGPSRPPSPGSAYTEVLSSAISGTTLARALVDSFIVTNESRGSRYRVGVTRQDSATLPRGEHPFHTQYWRERRSGGSAGDVTSPERLSTIPPVPPLPSSAELSGVLSGGLGSSMFSAGLDSAILPKSRRSSLTAARENVRNSSELPYVADATAVRRMSVPRGGKESAALVPPISPISEGSSPAPSAPHTPVHGGDALHTSSHVSLEQSLHRRSLHAAGVVTPDDDPSPISRSSSHKQVSSEQGPAQAGSERSSSPGTVPERTYKRNSVKPSLDLARTFNSETDTVTSGSAYSMTSFERPGSSTTPGTSIKSPGSYTLGSPSRMTIARTRSESGPARQNSGPMRPPLLPIGERPHSVQVPHSPSSLRTPSDSDLRARMYHGMPAVPVTARLPGETPVDSPDLLDFMFPVSHYTLARERGGSEGLSPLAIAPPDMTSPLRSSSLESLTSMSASRQTFPETPYAFSPMWSPMPPPLPTSVHGAGYERALPRTVSVNRGGMADMKMRLAQRSAALVRSTSVNGVSPRVPPTPPPSAESSYGHASPPAAAPAQEKESALPPPRLSAIEESLSNPPSHPPSPEPSSAPPPTPVEHVLREEYNASALSLHAPTTGSGNSTRTPSLRRQPLPPLPTIPPPPPPQPQSQPPPPQAARMQPGDMESPLGSPPPSYAADAEVSGVASRVPPDAERNASTSSAPQVLIPPPASSVLSREEEPPMVPVPVPENPPPPYVEEMRRPVVPAAAAATASSQPAPPPAVSQLRHVASDAHLTNKRTPRTRPPLPVGPRKPSFPSAMAAATRSRNGSVSSFMSNPSGATTVRKPSTITLSGSAPKFQTSPVKFKGMTMEAAQWTLTSQQLQDVVSTAIKQSSDPSTIRLLLLETYGEALPAEIRRLEARGTEIRTSYKLGVRRRRSLLGSLTSMGESLDAGDAPAMLRALEELTEVTDSLDQLSEELYSVTDQIAQLAHLRDVHSSSALAMALRKLHSKVIKQYTETQRLQEQLAALEADREDAWRQAHEFAQELDDRTAAERMGPPEQGSRRSSRVLVARKNSTRATKAGLRSSMYRRSHRSSTSSAHNSVTSPAMRSAASGVVPPVPPIPMRNPLGIVTDLPTGSSMGMSSESPSSDIRAMIEAQREICEMLGISPEELKVPPRRRRSFSASLDAKGAISPNLVRRASEVLSITSRTPGSAQTLFGIGSPLSSL